MMEVNEKTQNRTAQVWGSEDRDQDVPVKKEQCTGVRSLGRTPRDDCGGLNRSNWRGRDPFGSFGSEIISRLISQAEKNLKESEKCIAWHKRQSEELKHELEELKQLKQLHVQMLKEGNKDEPQAKTE